MSDFKVPYTTIKKITSHPNADKLEFAWVYDWPVVVQKNKYRENDPVVYIPIDSVISEDLEKLLFTPESKIKLDKRRVRQIKIRGAYSCGMLIDPKDIQSIVNLEYATLEQNVAEILNVIKYEPPQRNNEPRASTPRNRPLENPRMHKYGGVNNIKWYPDYFDGKEVIIQEKIHGSNCRAAYVSSVANTFWKKVKKFFGLLPKYEYCYGSNNVQLQERSSYTGFYGEDFFGAVLQKVDAFSKLQPGETIYGELYGPGIQKNYAYGLKEHGFILFDVKKEKEDGSQEYLDPEQVEAYARERGFDMVPVLYRGMWNKEFAQSLSKGPSMLCPDEKVKEGIVIKARTEYGFNGDKKALKLINEEYLDNKDNTDFH